MVGDGSVPGLLAGRGCPVCPGRVLIVFFHGCRFQADCPQLVEKNLRVIGGDSLQGADIVQTLYWALGASGRHDVPLAPG